VFAELGQRSNGEAPHLLERLSVKQRTELLQGMRSIKNAMDAKPSRPPTSSASTVPETWVGPFTLSRTPQQLQRICRAGA
jgi:hypothetical protein